MKRGLKISAVILTVILALGTLAACTPSEKSLKEKYNDKGYVAASVNLESLGLTSEDVEFAFIATKITQTATAICFKKMSKADDFYKDKKDSDAYKNIRRKGALVIWGSEEAVKIA